MNHSMQYTVITKILNNWKNSDPLWCQNVSAAVTLGKSNFVFPVPDATLIDQKNNNNYNIALEFKSVLENKHGLLTALGQAIAYTKKYSISYIIIPEFINSTNVEDYMKELFLSTKLNTILPIGLISYNINTYEPRMVLDINTNIEPCKNINKFTGTYWATFRDSYPDSIWRLLDIAYSIESVTNRKQLIWDKFYNDYLLPIPTEFWSSSTDLNEWNNYSRTYKWNSNEKQQIGKTLIRKLITKIDNSTITLEDAKKLLRERYFVNKTGDVPYNQLQKNIFNFINNLNLFDDFYQLTDSGFRIHKIGKLHGSTSRVFKQEFAKTLLRDGNHLDLIVEITNLQKEIVSQLEKSNRVESISDVNYKTENLDYIYKKFEEQGKIKINPARTTTSTREFLSSEFQLWGALELLGTAQGQNYFKRGIGYNFNWDKITNLLL